MWPCLLLMLLLGQPLGCVELQQVLLAACYCDLLLQIWRMQSCAVKLEMLLSLRVSVLACCSLPQKLLRTCHAEC